MLSEYETHSAAARDEKFGELRSSGDVQRDRSSSMNAEVIRYSKGCLATLNTQRVGRSLSCETLLDSPIQMLVENARASCLPASRLGK